jgi:hypothetical protein
MDLNPAHYIVGVLLTVASLNCHAQPTCLVESGRVMNIRLGGSIDQLSRISKKGFEIVENKPERPSTALVQRPHLFTLVKRSSQQRWVVFAVDQNRKILEANVTGPCATRDGIGVGSTVGQAMKVYGKPDLTASDVGYYIGFPKLPGLIFFLIDSVDIPAHLRGFADDEMDLKLEKEILSHHKARIASVLLRTEEVDQ